MVIEDRDISTLVKVEKYLMLLMIEFKKRKADDTITPREEGEKDVSSSLLQNTYVLFRPSVDNSYLLMDKIEGLYLLYSFVCNSNFQRG